MFAERPVLLYLAPTRALVNDVARRLEMPLDRLGILMGIRHHEQDDLRRANKPGVLVTTPESLDVLLWGQPKTLDSVRAAVLDEAHLLYNTQRGMQLAILLRRLERRLHQPLQVVATSATVGDGGALWRFFRPSVEPVVIHDPSTRKIERQIRIGLTSQALAERCGFTREGILRSHMVFKGARRDTVMFSLLPGELR